MKKYLFILVMATLLNACKEDGPYIDFTPTKGPQHNFNPPTMKHVA